MSTDGVITFLRRWAILGLLGSVVLWFCWLCQIGYDFYRNDCKLSRTVICADHLAFYTGARLTRFGEEDKLYDYLYVTGYQNRLFERDPLNHANDTWRALEAFRNPPFYALLYWPTCDWPFVYSALFWFGVSFLLTVLGVWWLTDDGRFLRRLLWVFSFYPTFSAFDYGQNTPISFAIFAATFVLLKKERPFAAGLVAGLLLFKPQLLLGLGVWAVIDIRRKWPCALGVAITGCLLIGVSYAILPTAWGGFIGTFQNNLQFDNFEQAKMHNPLAFGRLLLPAEKIVEFFPDVLSEQMVRNVHNSFAAAMAMLSIIAFWKLWRHRGNDVSVMFGGAIFLTLFANPHALIYEWMLLAITGLLWRREWRDRPNAWFAVYAAAWGVLYFSTELSLWLLDHMRFALYLRLFGAELFYWEPPNSVIVVQWSVPVLAGVGWYALKLLTKPPPQPAPA